MHRKSWRKPLLTSVLLFALFACSHHAGFKITSDASNPLTGMGSIMLVASGFIATEGPVWHADSGSLFFTDIPASTIYQLKVNTGALSKLRTPSGRSNGLALDGKGFLLAAEQQSRTITRMNLETNDVKPFISTFDSEGEARAFNSPNDMAIHANGNVYFTDPPFGLRGRESALGFNGVFVRTTDGNIELLKQFVIGKNPNGIIFNPQQNVLYIALSHDDSAPILAYDVDVHGKLFNEREFAHGQNNDGMAVDARGNLYVACRTGVRVWSSTGEYWGKISLPSDIRTTNVAFGGINKDTLYITNRSADLYAVKLNVHGHQ